MLKKFAILLAICCLMSACNKTVENKQPLTTGDSAPSELPASAFESENEDKQPSATVDSTLSELPVSVSEAEAAENRLEALKADSPVQMFSDSSYEFSDCADPEYLLEVYDGIASYLADSPKDYQAFGGGYLQNGYLHIMTVGELSPDFEKLLEHKYIMRHECKYNYEVLSEIKSLLDESETVTSYAKYYIDNLLWVTVATEEHKNELTALIESNGLPADGVKIEVTDILFENPL